MEKLNSEKYLEIVVAALQLFSERGFEKTTVDEIANKANVGKGTIYLYFKNKEQIFLAVIEQGLNELISHSSQILNSGSFMSQLYEIINYNFEFIEENEEFYRIFLKDRLNISFYEEPSKSQIMELHLQLHQLYEDFFQKGIDEGYLRAGNPNDYSLALLGIISHCAVCWLMTRGTESLTSKTDPILEIFLTGVQRNNESIKSGGVPNVS